MDDARRHVTAGRRGWRLRRLPRLPTPLLAATLAIIPFGSFSALQNRIVTGGVTDTVSQGRFLCTHKDDPGHVSYQVAYLKKHPPEQPAVYLLGGSATRECFRSTDSLSDGIDTRCGVRTKVRMLASSEQKLGATLAIVDNLPAGHGGVIVIGLHHTPFCYGYGSALRQLHGNEVPVRSPALRDLIDGRLSLDETASIIPGLKLYVDKYRDKRGVSAFRGSGISFYPHRYAQNQQWSDAFTRSRVRQWLIGRGRPGGPFYTYFDFNTALLTEAVTIARAKGYEVLLMEDPQNAAFVGDAWDKYKDKYRAVCDRLVADQGAHYVNINRSAGLVRRDFYDLMHLLPSGRKKWQPKLADELAGILRDHPPPSPSPHPSADTSASPAPGTATVGLIGLLGARAD